MFTLWLSRRLFVAVHRIGCAKLFMQEHELGVCLTWWRNDFLNPRQHGTNSCGIDTIMKGGITKRLDRTSGDLAWRHFFAEAYAEHLSRVYSDHCPLLVHCDVDTSEQSARLLRFHATWETHPTLEPLVHTSWNKPPDILVGKLVNMKDVVLDFNKEIFESIHRSKRQVERRLQGIQQELEWGKLSPSYDWKNPWGGV